MVFACMTIWVLVLGLFSVINHAFSALYFRWRCVTCGFVLIGY